eukprot:GHUV01032585.1.p1 GENE.GHUV01032585.1~~GHUV01032585.1.p1  ORF type:complete len:165 (-),score=25.95 GHUV01032585.1:98-592(-)
MIGPSDTTIPTTNNEHSYVQSLRLKSSDERLRTSECCCAECLMTAGPPSNASTLTMPLSIGGRHHGPKDAPGKAAHREHALNPMSDHAAVRSPRQIRQASPCQSRHQCWSQQPVETCRHRKLLCNLEIPQQHTQKLILDFGEHRQHHEPQAKCNWQGHASDLRH